MWLVGGVVRRYINILIIIINFPYSTCSRSFFGSSILTSLFILKCFFSLVVKLELNSIVIVIVKLELNIIVIVIVKLELNILVIVNSQTRAE